MRVSVPQLVGAVVVSFCVGSLVTPVATQGQAGTQPPGQSSGAAAPVAAATPTFIMVEFMKVAEGKDAEWLKLERETWKPLHKLRIADGTIKSWAALAQAVPGDDSNGPVVATVTTFSGWPDPTKTNWEALMKKANPNADVPKIFAQTEAARKIVRSEIWQVLDQTEPSVKSTN